MSHNTTAASPAGLMAQASRVAWLVCFLATMAAGTVHADSRVRVREASVANVDGLYELDAAITVRVPDDARRAIESGLTMRLDYEIEIARVRRYAPDAEVATLVQSYELGYHALSQRYLVRNLNTGEQQDFGTFQAALDRVSEVRGLPLIDSSLLDPDPTYELRVRALLDLRTTPDALAWLLFWADDWSVASDWFSWTLRP
jgi:hypothetical protein